MAANEKPVNASAGKEKMAWVERLAAVMERVVPDAITTSILLLIILVAMSLGIGTSLADTMNAYYDGLWNLLAFTMQMTLILVLSLILGSTPFFKRTIIRLSQLPRTVPQVVAGSVLTSAVIAYMNWGLSIALAPLVAIHFCRNAEAKGLKIDFLFLMGALAGAGAVWQFGLSGSAPLLMATPGHFLEETTGIMPLSTTIWAPATIILVISFLIVVTIAGIVLMPKNVRPISEFQDAHASVAEEVEEEIPPHERTFAMRMENSPLVIVPLVLMLFAWLYTHFFVKELSLDINSMNTIVLTAGLILHRNIARFTRALREAVGLAWPIVLLYHLYAGVAGLIQFTPVGEHIVSMFDPIMTPYTFPVLIVVISAVVSFFIPTSGGQWLIQGFVTVQAAESVGHSAQRGLLALSVGDHMGNLLTPFWAVVGASIARVDFRLMFGYRLIFAAIWFVMGTLAFTFLPC
ncbi:TIGR00366 family protein [Povalibacter sp.]|uniref:TIGR00366 family protein n=1 Tax=Povalibacter sp. TaxID=1962978 RepID=UPI002D1FAE30|nr:TIGR00366 family protein [Povalibacter sp.]